MEASRELESRELELLDLPLIPQYRIALGLDYPSLRAFCETAKEAIRLRICNDPFFWKKKTYYDFGDFYDIEERSGDWRRNYEYYRDLFSYDLIWDIAYEDQEKVNHKLIANDERKVLNANRKDPNGKTALMWAASKGYDIIVRNLLEGGADPNLRKDPNGKTALMWAASKGYDIIVRDLLEGGADPNLRNNNGVTALMYASIWGEEDAVQTLLEYGADVNVVNDDEDTALSLICEAFDGLEEELEDCEGEATHIVRMLLDRGISDINMGRQNSTPLMIAAKYGFPEVVKMLLEAGADPNLVNDIGFTALEEAEYNDHPEIVEILREVISE